MRAAVDIAIEALGAERRPADTALVALARQYADAIDANRFIDDETAGGLDPLARYGPKLTIVLERLHARAEPAATGKTYRPLVDEPPAEAEPDELAAMRARRTGGAS